MRILIVEDEIKIRHGLANLIVKQTGHEIVGEAKNGEEGLELVFRTHPDLVITDIKMPVMGGLEMIRELHKNSVKMHYVILSGYSEFEYAKQAIQYGVDDYLLKPLAPEDIIQLLEKIQQKLDAEIENRNDDMQRVLWKWINGKSRSEEILSEQKRLAISGEQSYVLLAGYGWDTLFADRKQCLEYMESLALKIGRSDMHVCLFEDTREIVCVIPKDLETQFLEESTWYIDKNRKKWIWAKYDVSDWKKAAQNMQEIRDLYLYSMFFPSHRLLTKEDMEFFQGEVFVWPEELEGRIRSAIYKGDYHQTEKYLTQFQEYLEKRAFFPKQIKEAYLKITHRIIHCLEDTEKQAYEKLQSMNYVVKMENAYTLTELKLLQKEMLHSFRSMAEQKEDISNYAIKRAISYIRTHYSENISQEELAGKLDITPEYLSALFNREVGVNFSTFLRDFRISHAKRLLKGTDKKVYEIAQEVGYMDSKYFNRVFKENVGVSPREFRQM